MIDALTLAGLASLVDELMAESLETERMHRENNQ